MVKKQSKMNLKAYNLTSGESVSWNSAGTVPGGGAGWSLPSLGAGVRDAGGEEIFSGDIAKVGEFLYLVKLRCGGFCLDGLTVSSRLWLHDLCDSNNPEEASGVTVVGNSKADSHWLASTILSRTIQRRGILPGGSTGGAEGGGRK